MDDSRQEFVSNVSHELKTPLTSMKVLADSINSMPDAPKELYQEFMEDITNEIERETKIINDLLSLVKMDKSAAGLNVSSVNINELLEQILKRLQPIADKQKVELVLESFRPVTAEVDEVKILYSAIKFSLAALSCGIAVQVMKILVWPFIDMTKVWGVLAQGLAAGFFGIFIYILVCSLLKSEELFDFWSSIKRRLTWKKVENVDQGEARGL